MFDRIGFFQYVITGYVLNRKGVTLSFNISKIFFVAAFPLSLSATVHDLDNVDKSGQDIGIKAIGRDKLFLKKT